MYYCHMCSVAAVLGIGFGSAAGAVAIGVAIALLIVCRRKVK